MDREKLAGTGETCRRRAPATWKSLMSVAINAPTPPPRSTFWIEGEMENETTKKKKRRRRRRRRRQLRKWTHTHTHTHKDPRKKPNQRKWLLLCFFCFVFLFFFYSTRFRSPRPLPSCYRVLLYRVYFLARGARNAFIRIKIRSFFLMLSKYVPNGSREWRIESIGPQKKTMNFCLFFFVSTTPIAFLRFRTRNTFFFFVSTRVFTDKWNEEDAGWHLKKNCGRPKKNAGECWWVGGGYKNKHTRFNCKCSK